MCEPRVIRLIGVAALADAARKAEGFGQEKPISDNSSDRGRAKNRRVELVKMG